MRIRLVGFVAWLIAILGADISYAELPIVSNVVASQRPDTFLVDIYYDVSDAEGDRLAVGIEVSHDGGVTYNINAPNMTGDLGGGVFPGVGKHIVWNAGIDWGGEFSDLMRVKVFVSDAQGFPGLEFGNEVPPGGFLIGPDGGAEGSGITKHVNIPWSYWLSKYEITIGQYFEFLKASIAAGKVLPGSSYSFSFSAAGSAFPDVPGGALLGVDFALWTLGHLELRDSYTTQTNHPALVTWYGAAAFIGHYGYDLPTYGEWEKAARGPDHEDLGTHKLYPFGDAIDGSQANYSGSGDLFERGTTPVGYYDGTQIPFGVDMANAYGLYDMVGNAGEWTRTTSTTSTTIAGYPSIESLGHSIHDVGGPYYSNSYRVHKGGSYFSPPHQLQIVYSVQGSAKSSGIGFRVIRRAP